MADSRKYCMGCMSPLSEDTEICPNCGFDNKKENPVDALKIGSVLNGRYLIGRVLLRRNDSINYIAKDMYSDEILRIAEYYPVNIVERGEESKLIIKLGYESMFDNCRDSFVNLWQGLGIFDKEISLPKVIDVVEGNGTVYSISKHIDSISLKNYFAQTKAPLSWARANSAFKPIFSALQKLHTAGIICGNISPSTVRVGSDGKLHLVCFTIPQCHSAVPELKEAPVDGFSPIEFYDNDPLCDESSDIYSVMALMYYCITGIVPQSAVSRAEKDDMILPASIAGSLTKKIIVCMVKSLTVQKDNRIKSVSEIIEAFSIVSPRTVQTAQTEESSSPSVQNSEDKKEDVSQEKESEEAIQTDEEIKSKKKKQKKETKPVTKASLVKTAISVFVIVFLLASLVTAGLYGTLLYKYVDIPILNKAFASMTFLPINKDSIQVENSNTNSDSENEATSEAKSENTYVTVPDFSTHTKTSIETSEAFNQRFKIIFSEDYSETIEKGSVISQSLEKGSSVLTGTEITIYISLGAKPVEIPNVIGKQYEEAEKILKEKGFEVKKQVEKNTNSNTPGMVFFMDKVAGLEFQKGTVITLSVYGEVEKTEEASNETKAAE